MLVLRLSKHARLDVGKLVSGAAENVLRLKADLWVLSASYAGLVRF